METLIAIATFLTVAAFTPGPNNFVVMQAAALGGLPAALPVIAGVVLGSLALLAFVTFGATAVFAEEPRALAAVSIAGCIYLFWLGARLIADARRAHHGSLRSRDDGARAGMLGSFAFQFVNPKSWMLVATAASSAQADHAGGPAFVTLGVLIAVIATAGLLVRSLLGSAISAHLRRPRVRAGADRAMGGLLVGSAILLLVDTAR